MRKNCTKAVLLMLLVGSGSFAGGAKFWTSSTFEDFTRGNLIGLSLNREGVLQLAPALKEVFDTDQAIVWAVARDGKGNLYLGTGHSGKVFRLDRNLKGSLFFDAPEPDVFALAVDKDGAVYVGTSPDGKIYKVDSSGKSQDFFTPQVKYIWSLAFAPSGDLYVGTGDRGRVFRVPSHGQGELFYDTEQSNVVSLAFSGPDLIAGTEPNGLVYRVSSGRKAFVIYDAPLAEIHSLAVAPDGSIYATAMGALNERRALSSPVSPSAGTAPIRTSTTVTVRAADEPAFPGGEGGASPDQPGEGDSVQVTVGAARPIFSTTARGGAGQPLKSVLFRIAPDSTVETLWNSTQENAFGVLPSGKNVLFSTDEKGRIYELTPDRQLSLLTQTEQEETTRLIPFENFILATTANMGKVFQLGTRPAASGSWESEVMDAGNISSWGRIRWTAEAPTATSVELFSRSGNSRRPDPTWSEWSTAYRQAAGEQIASPAARYLQWKAVLHSESEQSPLIHEITVAYLPRNRAPEMTELRVTPRSESAGGTPSSAVGGAPAAVRVATPRPGGNLPRPSPPQGLDIRWTATDPDQDELTYELYFRGEGEKEWKLLADDLKINYFGLENQILPDGKYRVKAVVSDSAANSADWSRTAEKISGPFVVDGTPPRVEAISSAGAASAAIRFRATDASSPLVRAEYSIDAEPLTPLLSEDAILDSQEETFTVPLQSRDGREHLLTLRVYDAAGNVGVGKAVWPASEATQK